MNSAEIINIAIPSTNNFKSRSFATSIEFCYFLFADAVGINDRMINEYAAVGGMRIGRGNRST
jgi:hypothetical protein